MSVDPEQLRVLYEGVIKQDQSNIEAIHYLATWHLERHNFQQARKYFGHLATLRRSDPDVWLCLSVCCAMASEFIECFAALTKVQELLIDYDNDARVKFCKALMAERKKDYTTAMEGYISCLNQCANQAQLLESSSSDKASQGRIGFLKELRGEVMLRIACLKKDMGALDQALHMCNTITGPMESFSDVLKANALCLKGLLHEMRADFPASEVVYRSVLQICSGHATALERLGRVYLRYRETIPAAVQCFFKSVETNPSNHTAWYLLGHCYMATSQYVDACEAYNRAANLNPNDPQIWCSLGVLYYAFGQYKEALGMLARALKLDPTMADAWYNVGALYDMCDQPDDAQLAYTKAKQNGLADRFARAGMGATPVAMQSLQFISNSNQDCMVNPQQQPVIHSSESSALSNNSHNFDSSSIVNNNNSNAQQPSYQQPYQQIHPNADMQQQFDWEYKDFTALLNGGPFADDDNLLHSL